MPIDVHAHYVPGELLSAVADRGRALGVSLLQAAGGATPALCFDYGFRVRPMFAQLIETVAERRVWLDRRGLDRQFLATWPDMYGYGLDRERCRAWHQLLNDTLAAFVADNADRFSWIASVPLPNAEDAAAALRCSLRAGALGVMVAANVEGVNIGEIALDPLWAAAEASEAPIIIHPVLTGPPGRAAKFGLTQSVQYTFDTTLGIASLLMSGVLDRFPRLRLVLSHGGGAFPYLLGRFDVMHTRMDRAAQRNVAQHAPSRYASMLAYDTILHSPPTLRFLADTVGLDRLVLGTDCSFPPAELNPVSGLREAGWSSDEIEAIADRNPRAMFPRLVR